MSEALGQLPVATSIDVNSDTVPITQGYTGVGTGTTKKTTLATILNQVTAGVYLSLENGGTVLAPTYFDVVAQGTTLQSPAPYGSFGVMNASVTLNTSNDRQFNYQASTNYMKFQGAPNSVGGVYQANLQVYSLQGNGAFSPPYAISEYSGIASQVTKAPPGLDPDPPSPGLPTSYSSSNLGPQVWAWYSYVSVQGNPSTSQYESPSLTWEFDNSANGDDTAGGRWLGGQINGHLTTGLGSGGYPASWTYGIYFELDEACINLCHIATNQYAVAGIEMRSSFVPTGTIVAGGTIGQTIFEVDYIQIFQHSNRFFSDGVHDFPTTSSSCPLDVSIISSGTTIATTIVGASVAGSGTNNGYVTLSAGASIALTNGSTFVPKTAPIALRDDAYISWGFDLEVGVGVASSSGNLTVKGAPLQCVNGLILGGTDARISFDPAEVFQAFYNEGDSTLQFVFNSGTVATNCLTIENSVGAVFNNGVQMWNQTPMYTSKPTLTGVTTDPVVANMASIGAAYGWWTNSTT